VHIWWSDDPAEAEAEAVEEEEAEVSESLIMQFSRATCFSKIKRKISDTFILVLGPLGEEASTIKSDFPDMRVIIEEFIFYWEEFIKLCR